MVSKIKLSNGPPNEQLYYITTGAPNFATPDAWHTS